MREAQWILEDGTVFCGWSFGAEVDTVGEVVFNTAMTGYPESLTDPSYAGQILIFTYPLIGNYGSPLQPPPIGEASCVPAPAIREEDEGRLPILESNRIHPKAIIVADYSEEYSHWNAKESLAAWLKREGIPGITGTDTLAAEYPAQTNYLYLSYL